jgi:hypothetical protein
MSVSSWFRRPQYTESPGGPFENHVERFKAICQSGRAILTGDVRPGMI